MTVPAFVLGAIALFTGLVAIFATAVLYLAGRIWRTARRYLRRRARAQPYRHPMSELEIAISQRPFAEISPAPMHPPINGSTDFNPDRVE